MNQYPESDLLPISGLQHLAYCERQCALIHVERVWIENAFTSRGRVFHEKAHSGKREVRGTTVTTFGLPVHSMVLGVYGIADVVELEYEDRTLSCVVTACPVEYKVGKPKKSDYDIVQLTTQALCLEEMLGISVDRAALFYGKTKHRSWVDIDSFARERVSSLATRFHQLVDRGETPPPIYSAKKCDSCSLFEICRPKTIARRSAREFIGTEIEAGLQNYREQEG